MGTDWIKKHKKEKYYKEAQKEGLRSRAAYKIKQIDEKFNLFSTAKLILDLCCAPGGWIQEIKHEFKDREVSIVGIDLVNMKPIKDVIFIQGDITDESILNKLDETLLDKPDIVISDCAPKVTGNKEIDYARQIFLVERVLNITFHVLKKEGHLVCKLFDGKDTPKIRDQLKEKFGRVNLYKPPASRKKSAEIYLIGKYYKKPI
ncbi:MAG TPA: RlmE family RNA methyltransferase [Candidatus Deferrimicrobium sp.]|nr:RlmE family RNA methyltransferase [Candidatus Deferrimicrobium sp.]